MATCPTTATTAVVREVVLMVIPGGARELGVDQRLARVLPLKAGVQRLTVDLLITEGEVVGEVVGAVVDERTRRSRTGP